MNTPVTIVGAGLGGLTLARVLQVNGIEAIVYESERYPDARAQGGMLDIHDYNGQPALEAAGLTSEFRAAVLPGREAYRGFATDGTLLFDKADDGSGGRPEVQRGDLRRWSSSTASTSPTRPRWPASSAAGRPELLAFITESDTVPVHRPHYALPAEGLRWDRTPGVTLIGDAAHLAAPDGEGANLAMQDAADLGTALASLGGDVEAALASYEKTLFPRSEEHARAAAYTPTRDDMIEFFAV
ncbi:FAD-dependent oxidoreductase [Actinoplanes sp. CA-054009]